MYIRVDVTPESKENTVTKLTSEKFLITVKTKAEHNLANKQALALLANSLKIPVARLRIINGHHTRRKLISVLDQTPAEAVAAKKAEELRVTEQKKNKFGTPDERPPHRNFGFKI